MSSSGWQLTKLGDVLRPTRRGEPVDPFREYRLLGVRLDGHGPFLRETVLGTATSAGRLFRVAAGDFICSRLFAWRGAFGVVPGDLDGCYVSGEFLTYEPVADRLDVQFLRLWFRLLGTLDRVAEDCSGSTPLTRNRFKEQFLLALEMPIPPLADQQRIVARIEEVAGKVKEVARLRKQMVEQVGALQDSALSMYLQPGRWPSRSVGEIAGEKGLRNGKSVKPIGLDLGFYCLVLSAMRNGRINLADKKPVPIGPEQARQFSIRAGDVFIMRGNGSKSLCGLAGLAVAGSDNVIFPDLFIRVSLPQTVRPAYFVTVWNSGSVRRTIEDKAKTTSGIWKVNQGHIESTVIPVPPVAEQDRIISSLERLQEPMLMLAEVQERVGREHDSLLPAVLDRAFKGEL